MIGGLLARVLRMGICCYGIRMLADSENFRLYNGLSAKSLLYVRMRN